MPEQQPAETTKPAKEKAVRKDIVIPPKKPKLSKAERRALQEQQRAAKASVTSGGGNKATKTTPPKPKKQQEPDATSKTKSPESNQGNTKPKRTTSVSLLEHLPPYRDPNDHPDQFASVQLGGSEYAHLHPAIRRAGYEYATQLHLTANARCRILLQAFLEALVDYEPTSQDVCHDLQHSFLKPAFNYWTECCRPHSVSMGNAFSFLKSALASLDRSTCSLQDAKTLLQESMEAYLSERMDIAQQAIANLAIQKIVDGDVVLVYANYEVVQVILRKAHSNGTKFRLVVVDSHPFYEAKAVCQECQKLGIECVYVLLHALSFVMQDVTKVLLGAEALLTDGSIYARIGTACVALAAKGKPVLVCAETYKISNRVQLESITHNELGNPKQVVDEEQENLRVISLLYDLTPSTFVSGIVTEMGILPPTSVAVLLREMNPMQDAMML